MLRGWESRAREWRRWPSYRVRSRFYRRTSRDRCGVFLRERNVRGNELDAKRRGAAFRPFCEVKRVYAAHFVTLRSPVFTFGVRVLAVRPYLNIPKIRRAAGGWRESPLDGSTYYVENWPRSDFGSLARTKTRSSSGDRIWLKQAEVAAWSVGATAGQSAPQILGSSAVFGNRRRSAASRYTAVRKIIRVSWPGAQSRHVRSCDSFLFSDSAICVRINIARAAWLMHMRATRVW